MAKHFGPHNMRNGYAAMGGALGRPIYKWVRSKRSVAEAIAEERAKAARQAKIKSNTKRK